MGVDPKIPEMLFSVRDITISVVAGTFEAHLHGDAEKTRIHVTIQAATPPSLRTRLRSIGPA